MILNVVNNSSDSEMSLAGQRSDHFTKDCHCDACIILVQYQTAVKIKWRILPKIIDAGS